MAMKPAHVASALVITLVLGSCAATPTSTKLVHEVVKLEHADCKDIVVSLRKLNNAIKRGYKLVVVGHVESNSILISGEPKHIERAKDLIAQLDQPRE
jgi:type II secretory pathway component GspD/PulD (secretin)